MTAVATDAIVPQTSRAMSITGWVLSSLLIVFMLVDAVSKLLDLPFVAVSSAQIGVPISLDRPIGAVELLCLVLYVWPRTAVLGAVLLTGVFGGAVATHLRLFDPLFSHILFGVYLGLFAWGGLWFRDARLRRLLPFN